MTAPIVSPLPTFTFSPGDLPAVLPTAVYIARDGDGAVLYVGMTGSLSARFAAHRQADKWWSGAMAVTVEMWPTRDGAAKRESWLINHFNPQHNGREIRQRTSAEERDRREAILIEMYGQGVHLSEIALAVGVSYQSCSAMVGELRKDGRLGRRPKPPARRWVRQPDGSFEPQPIP